MSQNRTWCSGTENHGHRLTHLTICVGPWHLSEATWPQQDGLLAGVGPSSYGAATTPRLWRTLGLRCCTVKKLILILLTTTECLLIVIFRVTSRSSIFRNDFWLCRKKLCDSVVRNCSELKSQEVFMNGKLAFGRCNTYFNVTFFFMPLYCAMSWVLTSLKYQP